MYKNRGFIVFLVLLVLFSIVMFWDVLSPDRALFGSDRNLGGWKRMHDHYLPQRFLGAYGASPLLGEAGVQAMDFPSLFVLTFGPHVSNDFFYAAALAIGSCFFFFFMRSLKVSWSAATLACMVYFWCGSNFTLLYAGHIGKFGVLMYAAMALLALRMVLVSGKWAWATLCGVLFAEMLTAQQDVALFFGVFIGAYALVSVLGLERRLWPKQVGRLAVVAAIALLISGSSALLAYRENVQQADAMSGAQTKQQKWEYCTQWSLPPGEVIDLLAPGYTGWRTGESVGPYWGRTGRSADWEKTGQGFRNLRLESIYIGAIPLLLAIYGLYAVLVLGYGDRDRRREILFWAGAALVALLLSFGKYFFLYSLFWRLPLVSAIRNPNKFVQVFQLCVGVLSAYGVDALIRTTAPGDDVFSKRRRLMFGYLAWGAALCLLLWAGGLHLARESVAQGFARDGWGQYGTIICGNMVRGLLIGALMCGVFGGGILLMNSKRFSSGRLCSGVVLMFLAAVACDAVALSRHYIKSIDLKSISNENDVIKFLKQNLGENRVALSSQAGVYGTWLSTVFPYHGIESFNVVQMPRMSSEYKEFLSVVGRNPIRMWQLASVRFVLAPIGILRDISAQPALAQHLKPIAGIVAHAGEGGVEASFAGDASEAQHCILQLKTSIPRFKMFNEWESVALDQTCERLVSNGFDPQRVALVSDMALKAPGMQSHTTTNSAEGTVLIKDMTARGAWVESRSVGDAVLLFTQKHGSGWCVTVDGRRQNLLRCNFLCMGVYVPAGVHQVEFSYRPRVAGLWFQMGGGGAALLCVGWLILTFLKAHRKS